MPARFADASDHAVPVVTATPQTFETVLANLPDAHRVWAESQGFSGGLGQFVLLPDASGNLLQVLAGLGSEADRRRGRFPLAGLSRSLPDGDYALDPTLSGELANEISLGWLLDSYRFDAFKAAKPAAAQLVRHQSVDAGRLELLAAGAEKTCDLINLPASHMGPDALEDAVRTLANDHGAQLSVTKGDALLEQNFPMIHAVGRASDQAPRLLDLTWGAQDAPKVTLVGKGVCFDTGGLNIKPSGSMGLMKKDMGGSATAIGLAQMIMQAGLPVRLRLLVPAVENSISAGAFRPQDVLISRKGLSVEVNNTDAEGRLVLADALALADEETPDLMLCMATLTGAARVALGADVPPFFTDDDQLATDLSAAAKRTWDPLWRLPFWDPYETLIEPDVADIDNAPKGGMAGAITAALFLRRFVDNTAHFAHFDLYGWTPSALPGRPKGGAAQGARAMFDVITHRFAGD